MTLFMEGLHSPGKQIESHKLFPFVKMPCKHVLTGIRLKSSPHIHMDIIESLNPIALRMDKTQWSFGHSEFNRVKYVSSEV